MRSCWPGSAIVIERVRSHQLSRLDPFLRESLAEAALRIQSAELPLFFSPLGELELINALQLRLFRKEMLSVQVRRAQAAFRADVANGVLAIIPLPEDILRAVGTFGVSVDREVRYPLA